MATIAPILEPSRQRHETDVVGMLVGFAAISIFFVALISAALVHRGMPGSNWAPVKWPSVLWINTFVAVTSSLTVANARHRLKAGDCGGFGLWWNISALLGVAFLLGQFIAWHQLSAMGVYLISDPRVSFFYVFTVAHCVHMLGGVLALLCVAVRKFDEVSRSSASAVVAMYWHFVALLWLVLFSFLVTGE